MRRTSTLQAAAAALGLLAGFTMAPEGQAPLDRDLTPYPVAVAWRTSGPPELPGVSGVEVDDWGGRMAPAPHVKRRAPEPRVRARTPQAKPKPAPRAAAWPAGEARPLLERDADRVGATVGVPRGECPREAARARSVHLTHES